MLTQDRLKELLHYDPNTGIFKWLDARNGRVKIGSIAGSLNNVHGYIIIRISRKMYGAHRLAWLYVYGESVIAQVDHINGERADNRICNLRLASNQENGRNRGLQKNNKTGYKGVHYKKTISKFSAEIRHNGKKMYLGYFKTAIEASDVYQAKAKELHGEFYHAQ